jgi:hypothetical protein
MVLPLNVYRRSLVRPNNPPKLALQRKARSARTPPSTFLFLPIQLSNSPGREPLSQLLGATEAPPLHLHRTTNDNRITAGCLFTHLNEEHRGTEPCLGRRGQGSAALSGWVIGPRFVYCQRLSSTNCRIVSRPWGYIKDRPFPGFPPHLSHNVATFWVKNMQCFAVCQPFVGVWRSASRRTGRGR